MDFKCSKCGKSAKFHKMGCAYSIGNQKNLCESCYDKLSKLSRQTILSNNDFMVFSKDTGISEEDLKMALSDPSQTSGVNPSWDPNRGLSNPAHPDADELISEEAYIKVGMEGHRWLTGQERQKKIEALRNKYRGLRIQWEALIKGQPNRLS